MQDAQLHFQTFQQRPGEAFPDEPDWVPTRAERYSLYAVLASALLALLGKLLEDQIAAHVYLIAAGLAGELLFGVIYVVLAARRTAQDVSFNEKKGAAELDQDFRSYVAVTTWLRGFPEIELRNRLVFASIRAEGWQRGTSLVWGSVEKLGMLPIIAALYLQFNDTTLSWPPNVTALGVLLAFLILTTYTLGLWAYVRKVQAVRFERFLKLALDPDFKLSDPDKSTTIQNEMAA